jgi:hypothetical protein
VIITAQVTGVAWWPEVVQLLILSGLVRQDLVTISHCLLPGGALTSVSGCFIHLSCPSWIPRWLKSYYKREQL